MIYFLLSSSSSVLCLKDLTFLLGKKEGPQTFPPSDGIESRSHTASRKVSDNTKENQFCLSRYTAGRWLKAFARISRRDPVRMYATQVSTPERYIYHLATACQGNNHGNNRVNIKKERHNKGSHRVRNQLRFITPLLQAFS